MVRAGAFLTMLAAIFAVGVSPGVAAEGVPHTVIVTTEGREVIDGHQLRLAVKVFDDGNRPVDVDHPDDLIEVRDPTGEWPSYRIHLTWIGTGRYSGGIEFRTHGMWQIVVAPDWPDDLIRRPPIMDITVTRGRVRSIDPASTLAFVSLVVLIVSIVVVSKGWLRRPRQSAKGKPEPEAHDTWWW